MFHNRDNRGFTWIVAAWLSLWMAAPSSGAGELLSYNGLDWLGAASAIRGPESYDPATGETRVDLVLKNNSDVPVRAPIIAVISDISITGVKLKNASGMTEDGKDYVDFSGTLANGVLARSASTAPIQLRFQNPTGATFTYQVDTRGFTATVIYVDRDAKGAGTGKNWTDAYTRLNDALAAAKPLNQIWVADGVYTPAAPGGPRTASFQSAEQVHICAGFAGGNSTQFPGGETSVLQRDIAAHPTIFSGDLNGNDAPDAGPDDPTKADNAYHVIYGAKPYFGVDGATINGGNADGGNMGGGAYTNQNLLFFINCRFVGNYAAKFGGAIATNYANLRLINCRFEDNHTAGSGGAMWSFGAYLFRCTFIGNTAAGSGGAVAPSGSFHECHFESNSAVQGGALSVNGSWCKNSTFLKNSASGRGGAVYHGGGSDSWFLNCLFMQNHASSAGALSGAVYCKLAGCVFSGNSADQDGGAVIFNGGWSGLMSNCTFYGNTAGGRGGGLCVSKDSRPTACIFWSNVDSGETVESAQVTATETSLTLQQCCVQGWSGSIGGAGNIGADPLLIDPAGVDGIIGTEDDNLRIRDGSPCIDAGNNTVALAGFSSTDTDPDGAARFLDNPRILDRGVGQPPIIDIGAYENVADCNANGIPDSLDIFSGASLDTNNNRVPDECDPDCNSNGLFDDIDIANGTSQDCNANAIPDECDIASGFSRDCNENAIPEECDLATGVSKDCNANAIPDDCDITDGRSADCNGNQLLDECDLASKPMSFASTFIDRAEAYPVAAGDVDGDGNADLVLDGNSTQSALVLLNSGSGSFTPAPLSSPPDLKFAMRMVLADVNADHLPDLIATVSEFGDYVALFLNRGSDGAGVWQGFGPRAIYLTDQEPRSLAVGDLDNDGLPEIVTANHDSGTFTVFWNLGNGKFSLKACFPLGASNPTQALISDFDGDGYGDVATVERYSAASVRVWLNNRDGTFRSGLRITERIADFAGAAGDWDGDGDVDLAVGDYGNSKGWVLSNLGRNGDGAWLGLAAPTLLPLSGGPEAMLAADLDLDRDLDLVVDQDRPLGIAILRNDGAGQFTPGHFVSSRSSPHDLEANDLNGDGRVDLAVAHFEPNRISLFFNATAPPDRANCNANGTPDECDIQAGSSNDCNTNNTPDECETDCNHNRLADSCDIASGDSRDCDSNGVPDECDPDCNGNAVPDACDVAGGVSRDCDTNAVPDECDFASGRATDANGNQIPDACDDCDSNGIPDGPDLASGAAADCNHNGAPDACDIREGRSRDCDADGRPDDCQVIFTAASERLASPFRFTIPTPPLAAGDVRLNLTIRGELGLPGSFARIDLNQQLVHWVQPPLVTRCPLVPDLVELAIPENTFNNLVKGRSAVFEVVLVQNPGTGCGACSPIIALSTWYHTASDCNLNLELDHCDILDGISHDCDADIKPDECEPNTDGDAYIDDCDTCRFVASDNNTDTDQDGFGDICDNCPAVPNTTQADLDGDRLGDACDDDLDNDDVINSADNCPTVKNTDQADADGDHVGNLCDACPNTIVGVTVDAKGCPPVIPGDFDRDGDVDLADVQRFQPCVWGPAILVTAKCRSYDLEGDRDVDQSDFAILQRCFSGQNTPADPSCMN